MKLTKKEMETLNLVMQKELDEAKEMIEELDGKDKKEMEKYALHIEKIIEKINE